jgi:hypothetical protein
MAVNDRWEKEMPGGRPEEWKSTRDEWKSKVFVIFLLTE